MPITRNITALDMIRRAYRLIGVYSIGEPISQDEAIDGLSALNSMVDGWANESLMIYSHTLDSVALTAGVINYTIGATGTIISTRPSEVLNASYINYQNVSTPLGIATLEQYNTIPFKALSSGIPNILWYEPTYPNASITLYPAPIAGCTLNLWSLKPLVNFFNLTDVIGLPPGYEDLIVFNLAIAMASEMSIEPTVTVVRTAAAAKKSVKRQNTVVPILQMPSAVMSVKSGYARFIL